jgi:hypothetical protein
MAPVTHAGRVDASTVLLADDDEDFRVALAEALASSSTAAALRRRSGRRRPVPERVSSHEAPVARVSRGVLLAHLTSSGSHSNTRMSHTR